MNKLYEESSIQDIADAIREKNGLQDTYKVSEMGAAIRAISANSGLTDDVKQALLDCFEHVAWIDEHGQDYYDALETALNPPTNLLGITAVFNSGGATIYNTATLNDLKQYLTVTAMYDDGTSVVVTNYTLSGTVETGQCDFIVTYGGKTASFRVNVVEWLTSITATYTQSGTVTVNDSLNSLKSDLVVHAYFADTTSEVINDYTLSGALEVGTSTITVTYLSKTATFNVTVSSASYVTSGLISRWDGIDNTSNGHDGTVTTWEDLVGSHDLVMNDSSKVSWASDGLVFSGQQGQHLVDSASGFGNTARTVEMVLLPAENQTAFVGWFGQSNLQRSISIYNDNTFKGNGTSGNAYDTGLTGVTDIISISAVYDSSAATGTYRCNNAVATQSNKSHSFNVTTNQNTVRIGGDMQTGNYPFKGKILAIRVYDRALLESELTQNYNVDLERFSLGGDA